MSNDTRVKSPAHSMPQKPLDTHMDCRWWFGRLRARDRSTPSHPYMTHHHTVTLTIPLKAKKKRGLSKEAAAAPTSKVILDGVGGEAPAGAVTAIMGPTGEF